MKKMFTKVAAAALMVSAPLMAGNYSFETNSLFGIEGGYNSFDVSGAGGNGTTTKEFAGVGVKIGAETTNYRIFINGRGYSIDGFDYAYTYGIALQYKFNFAKQADFFIGGNGGMADMKPKDTTLASINESYFGGDVGFDIHASELIDIQLGGRIIHIANFDNMATGYASIIIKWQMD